MCCTEPEECLHKSFAVNLNLKPLLLQFQFQLLSRKLLLHLVIVGLFCFISAHEHFVKHEIYLNIA